MRGAGSIKKGLVVRDSGSVMRVLYFAFYEPRATNYEPHPF